MSVSVTKIQNASREDKLVYQKERSFIKTLRGIEQTSVTSES